MTQKQEEDREAGNDTAAIQSIRSAASIADTAPDGGYGWVVVACVATTNALAWGINATFGVYLSYYITHDYFPEATSLEYAFVGGLGISLAMLVAPLVNYIARRWHYKIGMMIGVLLEGLSFIGASFSTRIWQLFLSQGVCFGVGMGFLWISSIAIPAQWFQRKRALAMGLVSAGSGVGGIVFGVGTNAMIENISLAWSFRITAFCLIAVQSLATLLVRDRIQILDAQYKSFDFSLMRTNRGFVGLIAWGVCMNLGYIAVMYSLASYSVASGLTYSQGSIVTSCFSVGGLVGRPLTGFIADNVGRINMASMMSIFAGLTCFAIWIPAHNYATLIVFSIAVGASSGVFWSLGTPVTAEVVGIKHLASAQSILWLCMVPPCLLAEVIALAIVGASSSGSNSGSAYLGTIIYAGSAMVVGGLSLLWTKFEQQRRRNPATTYKFVCRA